MRSTFRSLRVRNYRIYAVGSLISNIGTWLQTTAQAWLVLVLTGSGAALGVAVALQLLPSLLFSPLAGLVADRHSKRKVLALAQVAMAVPAGVLGVLAFLETAQLWQVYALVFVFGLGRAFEAPARQSFVAEMVETDDLANAVSLNSASFNSARLVGPALAGVMIATLGSGERATGAVIIINAVSYVAVVVSLLMLDAARLRPAPVAARTRGAIREGVRYVGSRPDLVLTMAVAFFLGAFGMNFQITSALMATEVFGYGAGEFGLLGSVLAVGSLAGALLAARRRSPRLKVIVVAALAFSAVQLGSGLMPTYWMYAAVLPLLGITLLTTITTVNAYVQLTIDPMVRGRVASLYLMVVLGSVPLGAPVIGYIAEHLGARSALVSSGVLTGIGVAVVAAWYVARDRRQRADRARAAATRRQSRSRSTTSNSKRVAPVATGLRSDVCAARESPSRQAS